MASDAPCPPGSLPPDVIHIRDLRVRCIVGVLAHERTQEQDVLIHLALHADLRKAGESDDLTDTIDYGTLEQDVVTLVEGSSFQLIEALAAAVAQRCLRDERVAAVRVRIDKPAALTHSAVPGVEIFRRR